MTITIQGKSYELFQKGRVNLTVAKLEDKGMMSFKLGDDPKPKLLVYFKPEGAQGSSTISVLCTNSRHPDAIFHKICRGALNRIPDDSEDLEALLIGKPLTAWNDHRIGSKDGLVYNQLKDFGPPDPPAEGTRPAVAKRLSKSGRGIKMAGGNGSDAQLLKSTEVGDEDDPYQTTQRRAVLTLSIARRFSQAEGAVCLAVIAIKMFLQK